MIVWPAKDPGETLDYTWIVPIDAGDEIATFTAQVVDGSAAIESQSDDGSRGTVWISGGAENERAMIGLTATTTGGRTFRDTAVLPIIDRAAAALASFRLAYPAFASVDDGVIGFWIAEARGVTANWIEADRSPASLALAAHNLSLSGYGKASGPVGDLATMGVSSFKSASMSVSFERGAGSAGGYGSTQYGLEFQRYLRRNVGGPRLVGLGC